jgi:RNA polymerase sigma-70 factor (ECF subfamily)
MPEDQRSDEQLIQAYFEGERGALDILIQRYHAPLWNYIRHNSWNKRDKTFIDDILQKAFLIVIRELKQERFHPKGPGSFRSWIYQICQNICWIDNKNQSHQPKLISERYPEELPENLIDLRPIEKDEPSDNAEFKMALARLEEEDRRLLLLKTENSYEKIHQMSPYDQIELPELRQKVCRLRKYIIHLIKEIKYGNKLQE